MNMDALIATARKHRRLIDKLDGVTYLSDVELVKDIGWSVHCTIVANEDGWAALGLRRQLAQTSWSTAASRLTTPSSR